MTVVGTVEQRRLPAFVSLAGIVLDTFLLFMVFLGSVFF